MGTMGNRKKMVVFVLPIDSILILMTTIKNTIVELGFQMTKSIP